MNKSIFITTGGYPLKAERLQELENAYSIFNSLGKLAGNLTIISGCAITGTTVGDGYVYINGELLEFKTGAFTANSTVIIVEENIDRAFKNGLVKTVYKIRYAAFGTAETSWLWSDFKRVDPLVVMMNRLETLEKKTAVFQSGGGMVLWNKPAVDIPDGWQEVVEWRERMPIGWNPAETQFNQVGKVGGSKTKKLSVSELPKISPETNIKKGGNFGGNVALTQADHSSGNFAPGTFIKPFGGDQPFSILNPYRVVMFIEYIE